MIRGCDFQPSGVASRWRAYLPSFRWARFRLVHEAKDGAYMPIRMTQIVGGRWWSLSLTRTSPARVADPVTVDPDQLDRAMVAYRRGARMTTWEECIEHDADRTLAGLRAALTEIGFHVERSTTGSYEQRSGGES